MKKPKKQPKHHFKIDEKEFLKPEKGPKPDKLPKLFGEELHARVMEILRTCAAHPKKFSTDEQRLRFVAENPTKSSAPGESLVQEGPLENAS
jgi:hypothetical protein